MASARFATDSACQWAGTGCGKTTDCWRRSLGVARCDDRACRVIAWKCSHDESGLGQLVPIALSSLKIIMVRGERAGKYLIHPDSLFVV
ncbi:hypothetical protein GGQ73_004684 [Rhizobium skierniewicense]|uniref:Uncharacterized protein n=1 Tax=Rhizobium skierniewicense TaxID=984260 RepID=A0A7W6G3Y5_9HYPH|nr:hypothetical protein [Rhizobium skierniewicense]